MLPFSFRQATAAALLSGSFSLAAQQPAPQSLQQRGPEGSQAAASLSITTHEVLVDVVVTGKDGQPVPGLTAADFNVTEEGDPQRIAHLEEHLPMSAEEMARLQSAPALPPNTFTNYTPVANTNSCTVILLDALDTHIQAQMELREQLIDAIKHMPPGIPVAIFQMDTEMRLIQGFTADPHVLLEAAKSKRDMPTLQRLVRGSPDEYRRARLGTLHQGFQMMGRYLNGFPGRKNLIWFTGEVPRSYLSDPLGSSFGKSFRDDFSILGDNPADLTDALTLSRVAVYPIDARGLQTPPQYEASNNVSPSPMAGMNFETAQAFQHMDLNSVAEATGGRAYYNTNGIKQAIAQIIGNGSNYYTLAYATTNKTWNGQFRHIKVKIDRPGVRAQYRQGYYAVDRAKQEQRLLAALRKKRKTSANPFGDDNETSADANPDSSSDTGEETTAAPANPGGALVRPAKGGFQATMQLGAIPPTEVVFTAGLSIDDKVQKLNKKAPLPPDNFMSADYRGKPFRIYTVHIQADARGLHLTPTANGFRRGTVEFVTLVFDQSGNQVNSLLTTAELNVNDAHYRRILASGLGAQQQIAVPVKGNYFLRVGVHDVASNRIGALEIPVDEVHAGVSGEGIQKP
ncbi:MAG TPA: VWA domain-containing protein [Terracidiphilus sp.]